MSLEIHERLERAQTRQNAAVIGRMASGWAVLGDAQFLPGYSLLLADPWVPSINDLALSDRSQFLQDMLALGDALLDVRARDALLDVTDAHRINYEVLGNADPVLHAHVWPRYPWEDPMLIRIPAWRYDPRQQETSPFDPVVHRELMTKIYEILATREWSARRDP